jgi:hypothetical protein
MRAPLPALLAVLALSGCATVCRPATLEVAAKEDRARVVTEVRSVRAADGSGRIVEQTVPRIVHDYLVRDPAGVWHHVSEAEWRGAQPGKPLEVCR